MNFWYRLKLQVASRRFTLRHANLIILFAFSCICLLNCGCLINHSHHTVLRQDEPLQSMTFESEYARSAFEQWVERANDDDSNRSSSSFAVPFIVGLKRSKSVSNNAVRNDVAALLDVNRDHHISDYEVSLRDEK